MTTEESHSVHTIDDGRFSHPQSTTTETDTEKKNLKTKDKESLGFWSRVWNDFCNRELLPLKILFFVKAGTVFVLYPYLNLHFKSLGLEAEKAGLSNALTIVTIIGQPLSGIVSDKIGNFKVFLSVITLITPIPALLMLIIPLARETILLPQNMTFSLTCETRTENLQTRILTLESLDPHLCVRSDVYQNISLLKNTFSETGVQCHEICSPNFDQVKSTNLSLQNLPLEIKYLVQDSQSSFTSMSDANLLLCKTDNLTIENQENCLSQLNKSLDDSFKFSSLKFKSSINFHDGNNNHNLTQPEFKFREDSNFTSYPESLCHKRDEDSIQSRDCSLQCFITMPRAMFCSNDKIVKIYDENLTFWTYNVLRVILGLFSSTCWILFEGAVLAIIKEKDGDYGLQRVTSQIAAIIMAPLAGFMIAYFNDFRPAFYLYAVLQVFCAFLSMKIDLNFKQPSGHIIKSLLKRLKDVQIIALFIAVLASGTAWGFLESFLFWFLQNLGGDGLLMGLTITVGGLAGLPFLLFNKPIIEKIGHVNIVAIGLIFYGIRLVGYSFITDPWMCLPYESLEAITASLAITAANTYASLLASEDTVVSIQGIVGALYYSVGRSIGSLIGGYLIKLYGDKSTYQIMAIGAFVAGVMYLIFNVVYTFVKKFHLGREKRLQRSSIDIGTIDKLKFDGGYVGPFVVAETDRQ